MVRGPWAGRSIVQLSLVGLCQGQQIVNVLHFEKEAVADALLLTDAAHQADGTALANDWLTNLLASWRPIHTPDYTLQKVVAQVLEVNGQIDHRLVATEVTSGSVGTGGNPSDDLTSAAVVKWRTPIAGRSHRGRSYIGPLEDTWGLNGSLVGAYVTLVNTWRDAMITRYTGSPAPPVATWNLTIYSRPYTHPHGAYVKRVGGLLTVFNDTTDYDGNTTHVTAAVTDPIIRVQRRREIGVGS
jgi:hypothetical protein